MIHKYVVLVVLLLFLTEGKGQDRVVDKKFTYWTRAYIEYGIKESIQLDIELDNRRYFMPHIQFQSLGRVTLLVHQKDWLSYGSGLTYSLEYSEITQTARQEIRPHQEVTATHSKDRWDFSHRLRLEQRFIQDTIREVTLAEVREFRDDDFSFSFRSRYNVGAEFKLIDTERKKGHTSLELSSELMINAYLKELFDTFRQYIGFRYYIRENTILELGYLKSFEYSHLYSTMFNFNNIRFTFRQRI